MIDIEKIDTNLKAEEYGDVPVVWHRFDEPQFSLHGLITPNEKGEPFLRLPLDVAKNAGPGVEALANRTAGGRIRFITDSPYIAIKADLSPFTKMRHMPLSGSAGFDLYFDKNGEYEYIHSYMPNLDTELTFDEICKLGNTSEKSCTINFPLYSGVTDLYIGLAPDCTLKKAADYDVKTPVVYYGSSITQGGCVSRPGNAYQSILSRRLNCDFVNLGFAGNAKAQPAIAEYISNLNMSVFVYDYDHNAPTVEYLQETHERMFLTIRDKNPELPIIMISRPKAGNAYKSDLQRIEIIKTTYQNALDRNDKNVYFIDGSKMFLIFGNDGCTVDRCHPNDMGFMCMAETIYPVLKEALNK